MLASTLLKDGALRVIDYRCSAGPHDRPFVEHHARGDDCLSFHFAEQLLDTLGLPAAVWRSGRCRPSRHSA